MRGDGQCKVCPGCSINRPLSEYGVSKRDGIRSRCRQCERLAKKAGVWSRGKSKGRTADQKRRYYLRHKEQIFQNVNRWRQANPDAARKYLARNSAELTDRYVRWRLSDRSVVSADQWPQALVEAKREQLRILRALKGVSNEEC